MYCIKVNIILMHLLTSLSPLGHKKEFDFKGAVMSCFKMASRICCLHKERKFQIALAFSLINTNFLGIQTLDFKNL